MMFSFVECTYPIKLPFTLKVKCRNKIATTYMNIRIIYSFYLGAPCNG